MHTGAVAGISTGTSTHFTIMAWVRQLPGTYSDTAGSDTIVALGMTDDDNDDDSSGMTWRLVLTQHCLYETTDADSDADSEAAMSEVGSLLHCYIAAL